MMRGKVTAADAGGVYVQTAEYGTLGPCQAVVANYAVGDMVLCVNVGDEASPELVVVGRLTGTGSASPGASVDNTVARFDGTGGALQDSGVTIDDSGNVGGVAGLNVSKSAYAGVQVSSNAGTGPYIQLATAGVGRWDFFRNDETESGSGAGSNLQINRLSDAGGLAGTPIKINRATGRVTFGDVGSTAGLEFGNSGPRMMMGTGGPSGISAPVGSTWRQTDANTSHGSLTGLLWSKVGTGTAEGTDWLPDFEGRWVSYSPTITTASSPQPSGWTQSGSYTRSGKTCNARFFVAATTANFGTGQYSIALPLQAGSSAGYSSYTPVGNVYMLDASAGSNLGVARIAPSATTLQIVYFAATTRYGDIGGWFGATGGPFTVAQNDTFTGQITYEIA